MSIKEISIKGIRSFKRREKITFSLPDMQNEGSGLNILVGPNNSGKSSLIEAIYLANGNVDVIPLEMRNTSSNDKILIEIKDENNNMCSITNHENIPSILYENNYDAKNNQISKKSLAYILPSNRNIQKYSSSYNTKRIDFEKNNGGINYRYTDLSNNLGGRFKDIIQNNKELYDAELKYILGYLPNWSIDSVDGTNFTINFKEGTTTHSMSGSGDGFINLFIILTALFDAPSNSTVIIDEPEISLHPDIQRKLMDIIIQHSKNTQIIISTHSPYFVDYNAIINGGNLYRFSKEKNSTKVYTLSDEGKKALSKIENKIEQPYLTDINSKEIFFLNEIILVEGIDDIYGYSNLFKKYNYKTSASFYGWGVGGAERLKSLLLILKELGYKKVLSILDNDKKELVLELSPIYPEYLILNIEAKDIRDKEAPNYKLFNQALKNYDILPNSFSIDDFINYYKTNYKITGIISDRKNLKVNPIYDSNIQDVIKKVKEYFEDTSLITTYEKIKNDISNLISEKYSKKLVKEYILGEHDNICNKLKERYPIVHIRDYNVDIKLITNNYPEYIYELSIEFITITSYIYIYATNITVNIENDKITINDEKISYKIKK